jgi:hypothetical protein
MCAEYGPPLPLDQQLCGFLESQVLPAAPNLRDDCHILRDILSTVGLAQVYIVGPRRVLLQ